MVKNKKLLLLNILGLVLSALTFILLVNRPLAILLISVVLLPTAFIYSQIKTGNMIKGTILTYFATIVMGLLTMWVYQFFRWPPTLLQVLLLNAQVFVIFDVLFSLANYFFNPHILKNFLHTEIFLLKLIKLMIQVLATLAAYKFITYQTGSIITAIALFLIWQKIIYEISGIYHE